MTLPVSTMAPTQGIVHEFYPLEAISPQEPWLLTLINGLWSLLLSLGLLLSCLGILKARGWRLGRSWMRGFLADYGVPLMVVAWSGISFAVTPAPHVPRRVATPNTWQVSGAAAAACGSFPVGNGVARGRGAAHEGGRVLPAGVGLT
jgi:hypothetical protein